MFQYDTAIMKLADISEKLTELSAKGWEADTYLPMPNSSSVFIVLKKEIKPDLNIDILCHFENCQNIRMKGKTHCEEHAHFFEDKSIDKKNRPGRKPGKG